MLIASWLASGIINGADLRCAAGGAGRPAPYGRGHRPGRPARPGRLAGHKATVGVTGSTLGGGLGPLVAARGWPPNSVTAAELVTPDGDRVRAAADHEPDLFWPCGAGAAWAW